MSFLLLAAYIAVDAASALRRREIPEFTQMLYEARMQVMGRMVDEAQRRGANAIIAMRFDASEIATQWTEICAYGTAVVVEAIPSGQDGATPQSAELKGAIEKALAG